MTVQTISSFKPSLESLKMMSGTGRANLSMQMVMSSMALGKMAKNGMATRRKQEWKAKPCMVCGKRVSNT